MCAQRCSAGLTCVILTVLITAAPSFGLPPPSDVIITCDSYGVVVSWTSTGLSPDAEFLLKIRPNHGDDLPVITTKKHQYNISEQLLNTAYNYYIVEVKTRDGEEESSVSYSPQFSFNPYMNTAQVICGLEFPPVKLTPGDFSLTISFINPLHLYRLTPALRQLQDSDSLWYEVISEQNHTFECTLKSAECEDTVQFKEEREEYCVSLYGQIRQTDVGSERDKPHCYHGSLKPSVPVSTYLIPVSVISVFFLIVIVLVFMSKAIIKKIKEKNRSKTPRFLFDFQTHNMSLISALKPEKEAVVKNPLVQPAKTKLPISPDSAGTTTVMETLANSSQSLDSSQQLPAEDHVGKVECEADLEALDPYMEDVSSGGLLVGYDRPHAFVEISPGDFVDCYGTRNSLFD